MTLSVGPSGLTPLAELPTVSLDLETTGLAVTRDRVIQIGTVRLDGATILEAPRLNQLIDPDRDIPEIAARITGITTDRLAGAPRLEAVIEDLAVELSGRVVIGHHIAFDRAILRNEAARLGMPWEDPISLDVGHLVGALDPGLPDLGFDALATALEVPMAGRHDAHGDALMVAEMYRRLLPRLAAAGVRTLADALALAERRADLKTAEINAGWHDTAADIASATRRVPGVGVDGVVFSRLVAQVMSAPPIFADPTIGARAAAALMVDHGIGALLIGDPSQSPLGILTERDLLRVHASGEGDPPVTEVMSRALVTVRPEEFLYRALGRMDRSGIRHLAVADAEGLAVGMISQRDLLVHRGRAEAMLGEAIEGATDASALAAAHARLAGLAQGLLDDGLDGVSIARVISRELRALTARAAELALAEMSPAPAMWCLMVLGSAGRGESLLSADQDNALIHQGGPEDDGWFAEFGERVAQTLNAAGLPLCQGGVMAAKPDWRGGAASWDARLEAWLGKARPQDLLNVDIFFDLQVAAGQAGLGEALHTRAVHGAAGTRPFLGLLAASVEELVPRFNLLGGLKTVEGRIDLKLQGLLPLVSLARALALACGVTARATPDRLMAVADAGRIGRADAVGLVQAHRDILGFILRQQLADLTTGRAPSSRVALSNLNGAERKQLKQHLKRIAAVAGDMRGLMTG